MERQTIESSESRKASGRKALEREDTAPNQALSPKEGPSSLTKKEDSPVLAEADKKEPEELAFFSYAFKLKKVF